VPDPRNLRGPEKSFSGKRVVEEGFSGKQLLKKYPTNHSLLVAEERDDPAEYYPWYLMSIDLMR
jgi:hypothetical protein